MATAGDEVTGFGHETKPERTPEQKKRADMVALARRRKCVMFDADETNRDESLVDIKFLHVPGEQWTKEMREARGDRPCYEFNELRVKALRVINDMRANRPQGKVRAVEDGDKETADTREGIIRNIWAVSDGDSVTDYAADYQVSGGMGAWRVETVWNDDNAWGQDIRVRPFKNPFCLWRDPACTDPLGLDADDWIVSERISKKAYEARWPDAELVQFDDDTHFDDADTDWYGDNMVRVCEYWYKEPTEKRIALLTTGQTVDIKLEKGDTRTATLADGSPMPIDPKTGQPAAIKRQRVVKSHKIMMCIVSGSAVLEEPTEWPGKYFPFIQVFGEWRVIGGEVKWHGLTRFSKDAQKLTNVTMTAIAETVMTAPQAHFWATPTMAEGHIEKWKRAHKELIPFLPYNIDPASPMSKPDRMGGADVPVALMEVRGISADLMKGTTGIFDASVGNQSNETSGRAITARARQGDIATFNYGDNMAKGVRLTWIIVDDLLGKVYTAEQSMRILGVDGAEKYVKINSVQMDPKTGEARKVNDLASGKYDVTYTVGPSFSTQRQEATELYSALGRAVPQVWAVAGDLIFKSMDLPYAEQIAERMRTLLPPAIQKQIAEGKKIPPEAQIAMAQVEQAMQKIQEMGAAAEAAMREAQSEQANAKNASADAKTRAADIDVKIAQLKAAEANLARDVAKFQQQVAEQAMKLQQGGDEVMRAAMTEALGSLEEQAGNLFAQYGERLQETHAQAIASTAATPRRRKVKLQKQPDGSFVGELVDEVGQNAAPMGTPAPAAAANVTPPPGAPPA